MSKNKIFQKIMPCISDISETGGERYYDLYSRLLKDRIIMLIGEIEENLATTITMQLLILNADSKDKPIYMYIHSPGGAIYDALMIIDTMAFIQAPIYTVATGFVASAAAVILGCGTKGYRTALPNARIMIHQPHGKIHGQATDIEIQTKEILFIKESITQLMSERCGMPKKQMYQLMERDNYLSAIESQKIGLIDSVASGSFDKIKS